MDDMEYQPNTQHGPHGYKLVKIAPKNIHVPVENTQDVGNSTGIAYENRASNVAETDLKIKTLPKNETNIIKIMKREIKDTFSKKIKYSGNRVEEDLVEKYENSHTQDEGQSANYADDDVETPTDAKLEGTEIEKTTVTLEQVNRTRESEAPISTPNRSPRKPEVIRYKLEIVPDDKPCLEPYSGDAFNGGSCLMVQPTTRDRTVRLFLCEFPCVDKLIVCVVTKTIENCENQSLNVICTLTAVESRKAFTIVLAGQESAVSTQEGEEIEYAVNSSELKSIQKYLLIDRPGVYVPIENTNSWNVRYYLVERPNTVLTSIGCSTSLPHGPILLGQIGLCPQ